MFHPSYIVYCIEPPHLQLHCLQIQLLSFFGTFIAYPYNILTKKMPEQTI